MLNVLGRFFFCCFCCKYERVHNFIFISNPSFNWLISFHDWPQWLFVCIFTGHGILASCYLYSIATSGNRSYIHKIRTNNNNIIWKCHCAEIIICPFKWLVKISTQPFDKLNQWGRYISDIYYLLLNVRNKFSWKFLYLYLLIRVFYASFFCIAKGYWQILFCTLMV